MKHAHHVNETPEVVVLAGVEVVAAEAVLVVAEAAVAVALVVVEAAVDSVEGKAAVAVASGRVAPLDAPAIKDRVTHLSKLSRVREFDNLSQLV